MRLAFSTTSPITLIPPGGLDTDGQTPLGGEVGAGPSKVVLYWVRMTWAVPASSTSTYVQTSIRDSDSISGVLLDCKADPVSIATAHRKTVDMDFGPYGQVFDVRGANDSNLGITIRDEDNGNATLVLVSAGFDWL